MREHAGPRPDAFFWVVVIYVAIWMAVHIVLGGCAMNGKVENGRWYFGEHGRYKEVSRTAYALDAISTIPDGLIPIVMWRAARREGLPCLAYCALVIISLGGFWLSVKCVLAALETLR